MKSIKQNLNNMICYLNTFGGDFYTELSLVIVYFMRTAIWFAIERDFFVTWLSNWICVAYSLKNQFTSMSFNSLEGVALTVVVYGIKKFVVYNFSTRRDVKHAHWLIIWKYFFYYRYHKNNLSFYDLLIVNRLVLLAATTCAVRNFTCDTLWISKIVYVNVNFTSSQSVS